MVKSKPEAQSSQTENSKRRVKKPSLRMMLALLIILALLAGGGYFAYKYNEAQEDISRLSDPQEAAKQEARNIIDEVSRSIELPKNENPTVATVTDVTKLKDQAFFAKAQNGDKVLIYTEARRAVLYRPSTNKVIEIAPINIGTNNNSGTSTQDESTEDED